MARSEDINSVLGERIHIGLSSVIGLTAVAGQIAASVKYMSGGSMEIGVTSGGGWGGGYQMSAGEVVNLDCSGTVYMVATGATAVAVVMRGRSALNV